MSEPPGAPTVLIADQDVGFVWWLGELFHESGYRSLPALSSRQALALLKGANLGVDLLIINPALRGASRLIKSLSKDRPPKVVLIQDGPGSQFTDLRAAATLERPSGQTPVSRAEWRQKVRKILRQLGNRAAS